MKKITFLFFAIFIFSQCSSEPSAPKADIEYNIDGVRILIPRGYQKVSSDEEIRKIAVNEDSVTYFDEFLFNEMVQLKNTYNHIFAKYDGKHFNYLVLKTDGPPVRLTSENTHHFQEQYEKILEEKFVEDSTYYFRNIQLKLNAAHMVKYLKFKYFLHKKGKDWYNTNYLIYSNNRTIGLSIISPHKDHLDLEDHMQFIKIKQL